MGDGARDLMWCQRQPNMAWRPKRVKAPTTICELCQKECVGLAGLWAHQKNKHGMFRPEADIRQQQDAETLVKSNQ